jgi:HEAT repeat protein
MKTRDKLIVGFATLLLLCAAAWWFIVPVLGPRVPEEPNRSTGPTPNETSLEPIAKTPPAKPAPMPAVAASTMPPSSSSTDTSPETQRKFSEMGVLDRGKIMKEIRAKDTAEIFQHFLDAGRVENDPMKQGAVRNYLEYALRDRNPDPAFLKKLQEFIESTEPSKLERGMMIGILASAGTKETVDLLIHEALTLKDEELRATAITGLGDIGYGVGRDDFTHKLAAMWFATSDPKAMRSSAESIGRIGSASGVEVLLAAALAPDGKDDVRREKAAYGLLKVNQPSAVPPLAAILEKNPPGSQANTVAFRTLNQIGDKTASEAVMKWFQTTDSSAAAQAKEWAAHVRTTAQDQAAQSALDPKVPFRSEEIRKALRAGLEAQRAGRLGSGR